MFGVGVGIRVGGFTPSSGGGGLNPDAQAFITATGITNPTEISAINTLVNDLQSYGLWSKMKALYPFVTDNRNLFSYTEDFGNAVWYKKDISIDTNTVTAPNGTLTADSIVENTANIDRYVGVLSGLQLTAVPYTLSVYLKKANREWSSIGLYNGVDSKSAWFNLNTGTIGTINSGVTASIESVGNGWYRCSVTRTMSATNNNYIGIAPTLTDGGGAYLGNGSTSIYIWGAQLEVGSTASTYQAIATTQQAFISNQFKYNLKNPVDSDAAFRLVFNGGWTFASTGATPNGTNGYADTKLAPSSVLTNNNTHCSYYSRTNIDAGAGNGVDIGVSGLGSASYLPIMFFRSRSNNLFDVGFYNYGSPTNFSSANTNSTGLYIGNRTSNVVANSWKNGIKQATNINTETQNITTVTKNVFLSSLNLDGTAAQFSNRQCAFSSIGDGLTDTEASNLYSAVNNFQVALSRNV